jgi:sugar phosphate isomerase/epimerase
MRLGIHIGTFVQPAFEEALRAAAAHGFECIHFNFRAAGLEPMPDRVPMRLCRRIADSAADHGIALATLSATFNMIHPDRARREEGLRRLDVLAEAARPLGTRVLSLCTGTRDPDDMWRPHPDNVRPDAWGDLVESLAVALQSAERHDVVLAVEPEVGNVVDSAAKARRLLDEMRSARLRIILDPANLFHEGELARQSDILESAFELLGDDLALAHAKDLDSDGEAGTLPAGRGLLDYDLYLTLLKKVGFDGPLILHGLKEPDVPACVKFLRAKLDELS